MLTVLVLPAASSPPGWRGDNLVGACRMRRPRNLLVLSGGGAYGVYSAGFLNGWTQSGKRPEFDVVTGISTGSLIAPLAFLGPDYDGKLGRLYTHIQAEDVFRIRTWVTIPFTESGRIVCPAQDSARVPDHSGLVGSDRGRAPEGSPALRWHHESGYPAARGLGHGGYRLPAVPRRVQPLPRRAPGIVLGPGILPPVEFQARRGRAASHRVARGRRCDGATILAVPYLRGSREGIGRGDRPVQRATRQRPDAADRQSLCRRFRQAAIPTRPS